MSINKGLTTHLSYKTGLERSRKRGFSFPSNFLLGFFPTSGFALCFFFYFSSPPSHGGHFQFPPAPLIFLPFPPSCPF